MSGTKTGASAGHSAHNDNKEGKQDQNNDVGQAKPDEMQFDHVAQQVPNIAEAVSWYMTLLPNARVLYQDTSWAFVEVGGTKLAFVREDQHPNHLAWRVSEAQLEHMSARYNRPIALHRDKTRSFYLEAPGGQHIEIISFDGSDWQAKGDK